MSVSPSAESVLLIVVMAVTGLFLVWLGRYVRRTQDLSLVAGTHEATVTDTTGLAAFIGAVTIAIGVLTVLVGLVHPLFPAPERGLLWGGYIVLALALAGWAHWRSREYTE